VSITIADLGQQSNSIKRTIVQLRSLTQVELQAHWRMSARDLASQQATRAESWQGWPIAPLNSRQHVAWGKGRQIRWLAQQVIVPAQVREFPIAGMALRLALTWWAEDAQIFVNGSLVQSGDLFDCQTRILLGETVQPGDRFDIAIRLVSPGHDDGALVRSTALYENLDGSLTPSPEPGFVADELEVLQVYLEKFAPEQLATLTDAIALIDWEQVSDCSAFQASLANMRDCLLAISPWLKQRRISLLGHAHLDLAWLWPVSDTWDAAQRTFQSILGLYQDFPELIFTHSTPALYDWIEQHRPDLFAQIQQQVAEGRWEIAAGLWVEPELNTVSGESLVRQVLYGQRYVQEKFGEISKIAWLPDSFGFSWQLPQILAQGGIQYFVTQKLRWNDSTEFPYDWFHWQAPDSTTLPSLMSAPIGTGIDPVNMADYAAQFEQHTGHAHALWLPGVGDHGGGPTRDMLVLARRWQQSPFFPTLDFSTALAYLEKLAGQEDGESREAIALPSFTQTSPTPSQEGNPPTPPTWQDELYLEFHRGCYTSHADQKYWNRQGERSLYQAELFASLATLLTGSDYPKAELETAWKQVLFNQFHDILPGSAIPEVYAETDALWIEANQSAKRILDKACGAIVSHISLPEPPQPGSIPLVVFNSLNWQRSHLVSLPLPDQRPDQNGWQVFDHQGNALPIQIQASGEKTPRLLFPATDIPGVGYRVFWLVPASQTIQLTASLDSAKELTLENSYLRVEIDLSTGDIASLFDVVNQQEVLSAPGNVLQAFHDQGQYWDAWNIDPNYAQYPLPGPKLLSVEWLAQGELQQRIRVVRQFGKSTIQQDYVLDQGSPLLKVETTVDWQERYVLLKAAFPLTVTSETATYEIPAGAIQRPTSPKTPAEKAKWEVPALQWADLGDDHYGVSVLNDCKYGYDAQPSQVRLTLLRGAQWPHPDGDRGLHQFTYALYPHADNWQEAGTVRRGYELNQPLLTYQVPTGQVPRSSSESSTLPPAAQLVRLSAENLVLMALKQSEDGDRWVLRCYDALGQPSTMPLDVSQMLPQTPIKVAQPVTLLEALQDSTKSAHLPTNVAITPWQILTISLI
jgi:alpha-mannosidase